MYIAKIPILNFVDIVKKAAFENGYLYCMYFIARRADAYRSYSDLKRSWASLEDLTGRRILFVFAGALMSSCDELKKLEGTIRNEDEKFQFLSCESAKVLGDLQASNYLCTSALRLACDEDDITLETLEETHTRSTSALRNRFGLAENDIPALAIVSTRSLPWEMETVHCVRLREDNLYTTVKSIISAIYEQLRLFNEADCHQEKTRERLKNSKEGEDKLKAQHGVALRYFESASRLQEAKRHSDEKCSEEIDKALRGEKPAYQLFSREIRSDLQRCVDLVCNHPHLPAMAERFGGSVEQLDNYIASIEDDLCRSSEEISALGDEKHELWNSMDEILSRVAEQSKVEGSSDVDQETSLKPSELELLKKVVREALTEYESAKPDNVTTVPQTEYCEMYDEVKQTLLKINEQLSAEKPKRTVIKQIAAEALKFAADLTTLGTAAAETFPTIWKLLDLG